MSSGKLTQLRWAVAKLLMSSDKPVSTETIAPLVSMAPSNAEGALHRMAEYGWVFQTRPGHWCLTERGREAFSGRAPSAMVATKSPDMLHRLHSENTKLRELLSQHITIDLTEFDGGNISARVAIRMYEYLKQQLTEFGLI